MRALAIPALLFLAAIPFQNPAPPQPVVVELFTSEGCSSCPPADQFLVQLARKELANLNVIPLGLHVDYWDHQGWRDRFSSARFTARQEQYSNQFRLDSIYTPQMVVDGRFQTVGSDRDAILELINRASREAKPVRIDLLAGEKLQSLEIACRSAGSVNAHLLLAITEDDLSSDVKGGENNARTLHHAAVVRLLEEVGTMKGSAFSTTVPLHLPADAHPGHLHAIVFAQADDKKILGAATMALVR
jgi:hypothetical protein